MVPMPPAAAVHEEGLPVLQPGDVEDVAPDGAGDLGQRRGLDQAQAGRDRQQLAGRYDDLLCVPAPGQEAAHRLAHRPAGDAVSDRVDRAAAFETDDLRGAGRRRIEPLPLHQVGTIEGGGDDLHAYLTGPRRPDVGHLRDGQDFRASRRRAGHGAHVRLR